MGNQILGQRLDQLIGAELSGPVARVADAEENGLPRARLLAGLRFHNTPGVVSVLLGGLEVDPADSVLHVELVLEAEGNGLGIAHDQQIVGHLLRVRRSRSRAVAGEELRLRFIRSVPQRTEKSRK